MKWSNSLTKLLKIKYPIIQAPMLGIATTEMVAASSNFGALGSLPIGGLAPDICRTLIHQTKKLTDQPFAVNLFAHSIGRIDNKQIESMQKFLKSIGEEFHINYEPNSIDAIKFYTYKDQIDVILEEKIPIVSFTFGALDHQTITKLHDNGVILIGTCTSIEEGKILDDSGIDIICAQGFEAGGHRGSFHDEHNLPQVGTFSLVPQLADSINRPIIAAGGIYNRNTIHAAMALGALGVQIGSAFLASNESQATLGYKNTIANMTSVDTIVTKTFSGRWARGISNEFIKKVAAAGIAIPDYPIQNSLTAPLRKAAKLQDEVELMSIWAGQSASFAKQTSVQNILKDLTTLP